MHDIGAMNEDNVRHAEGAVASCQGQGCGGRAGNAKCKACGMSRGIMSGPGNDIFKKLAVFRACACRFMRAGVLRAVLSNFAHAC